MGISTREGELGAEADSNTSDERSHSMQTRRVEWVQGQSQPTDHRTACSDVAGLRSGWEVKSARQGQDWHCARPSTT